MSATTLNLNKYLRNCYRDSDILLSEGGDRLTTRVISGEAKAASSIERPTNDHFGRRAAQGVRINCRPAAHIGSNRHSMGRGRLHNEESKE